MKRNSLLNTIFQKSLRVLLVSFSLFVLMLGTGSLFFSQNSMAIAAPTKSFTIADRVDRAVDRTAGYGTSDEVQGQIDRVKGNIQRSTEKAAAEAKGAIQDVKGQTEEAVGKIKGAAQEATRGGYYSVNREARKAHSRAAREGYRGARQETSGYYTSPRSER
jgi:uncharacterized protein YjbJ (UPF0337 family)